MIVKQKGLCLILTKPRLSHCHWYLSGASAPSLLFPLIPVIIAAQKSTVTFLSLVSFAPTSSPRPRVSPSGVGIWSCDMFDDLFFWCFISGRSTFGLGRSAFIHLGRRTTSDSRQVADLFRFCSRNKAYLQLWYEEQDASAWEMNKNIKLKQVFRVAYLLLCCCCVVVGQENMSVKMKNRKTRWRPSNQGTGAPTWCVCPWFVH